MEPNAPVGRHSSRCFSVTRGDPVIGGLRAKEAQHFFCPDCMTWMFTKFDDALPFVNVRPTMLDDCGWFVPFIETYNSEKLAWASTPAKHSFEAFPPPESFESLAWEYAESIREG